MKQLEKVQNNTTWAKASNAINNNNDALYVAVTTLEHAAFKNKGYYKSVALLYGAHPTSENGAQAFVYNSSNPTSAPYDIYEWVNDAWQDTGINGGNVNVNLDSKQDTLVGYSESVSEGKATQVAIQGDTIALSGKVSLGNVDNMESAILMSSSQAGAAIAKANTLEQSMNAIKSPVKPIQLNSQGKLELSVGKGLYVEEGKLCATGASSSGGGGGKTYSEGNGIIITDDKINVNYDADTMCLNSCGGLAVNIGEGFIMKDGKLSVQASVNAGNGLVKKGEELQVSVGTGLLVQDDIYVNLGKGLATDNLNKVNVNLDEQTLTTDSSGKVIVKKEGLIGNGLKQEYSKLAVNYGAGLAISNKALVIDYGAGLSIQDGKLVSTVQGGKTYREGQAIDISGNNEISVKYDGVTISTKDTTDNSLHVMLGNGLRQGANGIDVVVGSGLAIDCDNQLYSTLSEGKTYSEGDGIRIIDDKINVAYDLETIVLDDCGGLAVNYGSGLEMHCGRLCAVKQDGKTYTGGDGISVDNTTNEVSFKYGTSLESVCGAIQVAISSGLAYDDYNHFKIRVKGGKGIDIPSDGTVNVALGQGLVFDKWNKLTLSLHKKSGLQVISEGLGVNAGVALSTSDGKLNVQYGTGLTISNAKLVVDPYSLLTTGGGLCVDEGGLNIMLGNGLTIADCSVAVNYGTGLSVNNNNKIYVDTSKIAGSGIDLDGDRKTLTIGTEAAKVLAGSGLKQVGQQLVVDAENLSVNQATNASVATRTRFLETKHMIGDGWYGDNYMAYIQWEESIAKLKVDNHETKVDIARRASCADVAHGITYTHDGGVLPHGGDSYAWYNVYHSTPYTEGDCIILNLSHSFHHLHTASVTFAINIGYGDVNITQLGATPISITYDKIRVRWVNKQEVFIDVLIYSHEADTDKHYVQGFGLGVFTSPKATSDTTGIISEFSIRPGYFYAKNASADSFLGNLTGTADKAIADGYGNIIAATYAENFIPTNGLAIDNDRTLYLPNLTASVINGAVDKSKNGAQRVLHLSCGAIQIKLSTGLGIDECGNLYVTK